MKSALDVHRELLARGVTHEIVRLPKPVLTADDLPEALDIPRSSCVAVRCYQVVRSERSSALVAVLVRAGDVPNPASLLDALGATSLRPADAGEINVGTDYAAGLVSPLCLPASVELLADAALGDDAGGSPARSDVVYAAVGESGVALAIHLRDLLVAARAKVTTLTAQPLSAVDRIGWDGFDERPAADVRLLAGRPRRTG